MFRVVSSFRAALFWGKALHPRAMIGFWSHPARSNLTVLPRTAQSWVSNLKNVWYSLGHRTGVRPPNPTFNTSFEIVRPSPSLLEHPQALSGPNKRTVRGGGRGTCQAWFRDLSTFDFSVMKKFGARRCSGLFSAFERPSFEGRLSIHVPWWGFGPIQLGQTAQSWVKALYDLGFLQLTKSWIFLCRTAKSDPLPKTK